ncbi:MAG: DNA polymerase, partial [Nitrososphaera sp.]|nr:DNA polymerase [Nitrososphaera sp.]
PQGDKDRFKIRRAIAAKEGKTLIIADQAQLEMRLLACASLEPKIIDIFLSGKDIHTGNVELVFNIPYDEVVAAQKIDKKVKKGELPESALVERVQECIKRRYEIKTIGFGMNYGMRENKLARSLSITKEAATELLERYLGTYPAIKEFYASAIADVRDTGFAFTILGRRRTLPDINSRDDMTRWRAERQATNMPIQGSAADIMKMAMIHIYEDQLDVKYGCDMLLQVHDELGFECPKETADEAMPIIQMWMEHALPTELAVPLVVEIGKGENWATAK